jgi:hypothetical protein
LVVARKKGLCSAQDAQRTSLSVDPPQENEDENEDEDEDDLGRLRAKGEARRE